MSDLKIKDAPAFIDARIVNYILMSNSFIIHKYPRFTKLYISITDLATDMGTDKGQQTVMYSQKCSDESSHRKIGKTAVNIFGN